MAKSRRSNEKINEMITLIAEPKDYSPLAIKKYKTLGRVILSRNFLKEAPGILKKINILVVRLGYQINKKVLDQMPDLKLIASPTTGLNHFDLKEIKRRKIKLVCLRGRTRFLKDITSTAEETLGLMLALIRKIPWAFDDVKKGNWNRDAFRGHQLLGKTIGLIGCGRLGKMMAQYSQALGMKVFGYDPYLGQKEMKKWGIKKVGLKELFKNSDIVSLHLPLTEETNKMIKKEHLKLIKPSAYLINTARAEIVEKDAFLEALKKKWIKGAALDVLWNETGKDAKHLRNNPFLEYAQKHNNLIIVPHMGGATYEAMEITEDFIADSVLAEFRGFLL